MKQNYLHGYAIVRYDEFHDDSVSIEDRITVKKIVFDPDFARAEVERLNTVNADKRCYYFSQITRIEQPYAMPGDLPRMSTADTDEESQLEEAATAG